MAMLNLMDAFAPAAATSVKVMRMNGLPLRQETHPATEALLVLDGRLELDVSGSRVSLSKGELYVLPAGTPHAARRGSHGTLAIVELAAAERG